MPFTTVYESTKKKILSSGFIILHEIDTQRIVAKHNYQIRYLKQILFFHPKYVNLILKNDPLAINEITIKIVFYELENKSISVSVPDPIKTLVDYNNTETIGKELSVILSSILNT